MDAFRLWRGWLIAVSAGSVAVGLALVFAHDSTLFAAYNRSLTQAFWQQDAMPAQVRAYHAWVFGILGASIAGWGVVNTCVLIGPFARRERWAWSALVCGIAIWAPIDLLLSLRAGMNAEVVFVSLALLAYTIPLLAVRRFF